MNLPEKDLRKLLLNPLLASGEDKFLFMKKNWKYFQKLLKVLLK